MSAPHVGSLLLGRYRLTRHIARGGMGDVYEAQDEVLRRPVAVKLYRAASPPDRARFDAEVRVLAGLNHPGLVPVYDAGSVEEDAFVVLELVDGPSIADAMADGPMPPDRVARLGSELAEALAYIHARGVVHRDVTPRNVLCGSDGRARLVDFGIARLLDAPRVTSPQTAIGTAAYMAPEQVQGHDVTPAADLYSLGLVLLEALTGRKEFAGPVQEVAVQHLVRRADTDTGVPGPWRALLARMTAIDPAERPTAAEVRARIQQLGAVDVDAATGQSPIEAIASVLPATPEARERRARGRAAPVWAVAAALALAVASALTLSGLGGDAQPAVSDDRSTTTSVDGSRTSPTAPVRATPRAARGDEADGVAGTDADDQQGDGADEGAPSATEPSSPSDPLRGLSLPTPRAKPSPTTTAPTPTTEAPSPTTTEAPTPTTEPSPATTEPAPTATSAP